MHFLPRKGTNIIDTKTRILDAAQELMQIGGYNAFSFDHIADRVGIKKPSVVHHFANKEALGQAVVQRYAESFLAALKDIFADPDKTSLQAFDFYCSPYIDFGKSSDKVCLCGALAGEFMALPDGVKTDVADFFNAHIKWLEMLLKRGKKNGEFVFSEKPVDLAKWILASLQGALLIKRATGEADQVFQAITILRSRLIGSSIAPG